MPSRSRRSTEVTPPEQINAEVEYAVSTWQTTLAQGLRDVMTGAYHGSPEGEALTAVLVANGVPDPHAVEYPECTVTATYTIRGTKEWAERIVRENAVRIWDAEQNSCRPVVAVVQATPETPAPTRTLAGSAAAEQALLDARRKLYLAVARKGTAIGGPLVDRVNTAGALEPPPSETYTVMVPLQVTAYDPTTALTVARAALRTRYRDPALGQQNYIKPPSVSAMVVCTDVPEAPAPGEDASQVAEPTQEEVTA